MSKAPSIDQVEADIALCEEYLARDRQAIEENDSGANIKNPNPNPIISTDNMFHLDTD